MINISEDYQEAIRNATLFNDVYMNVFFNDQPIHVIAHSVGSRICCISRRRFRRN